ncbi:MAG: Sensor histidine kinase RcsC [Chroococcidiopsis sp. SAG 2025]|uniref:PleD family two-component system response regulator n=1 Tax=Chroococcidiopsis sp. SAG 2025 TaxID=171389 RepID=UPI002936FB74|nr:PleD family two-component system response regulator [Chroococcidiopsis sp. SAG 2025]MDV2991199.1 Sensor histidine kinase RcsC [Chroococcidiopsis sp. SAG 2025]
MKALNSGLILIVDDNPTNLSVLSHTLKSAGFNIRVAIDGESAIELVKCEPPDLILLDVQMETLDGFETCSILKADAATQKIPIIFITALADLQAKVKGFAVGAVDYITKPFYKAEVIARVTVHLQLSLLTRKVMEQAIALQKANQELQNLIYIDSLTQIANRRQFDSCFEREWRRLAREQAPLALILCDVDYFKKYNDCYGHIAGDICLQNIAKALMRAVTRPADLVARYGGEEFGIILPNTSTEGAIRVADRIQAEIEQLQILHSQSEVSAYVTVSLGISSQIPNQEISTETSIAAADRALYCAKQQGRNTYCICDRL